MLYKRRFLLKEHHIFYCSFSLFPQLDEVFSPDINKRLNQLSYYL